jgi:regulator of protease activity HflC (stomatin/prohibitin superfamily)
MTVSRSWTWVEYPEEEISDALVSHLDRIAAKWSRIMSKAEYRHFTRDHDAEADYYAEMSEEEYEEAQRRRKKMEEEEELELEALEAELARHGARMMRPYEHWNEEEKYMEYMETRYDNEY